MIAGLAVLALVIGAVVALGQGIEVCEVDLAVMGEY